MNVGLVVEIGSVLGVVGGLVVFYTWIYYRNKKFGSPGILSRSRLTCSRCQQTFDYDYIPGASVTAVRLGTGRCMACPLCHQWSVFDFTEEQLPVTPAGSDRLA